MMLEYFRSSHAKKLGADIAEIVIEFDRRKPKQVNPKYLAARYDTIVRLIDYKIQKFTKENRLNFYQKAQMGNSVRWALTEAGYERQYADHLVIMIMKRYI